MRDDRHGGFGSRGGHVPVQVGDEIDVTIEAVGEKGDGIAKKEGFVLFIPDTKEGQTVRVRVTKVLQKLGFAEVVGDAQGAPEGAEPAEEAPAPVERAPEPVPSLKSPKLAISSTPPASL